MSSVAEAIEDWLKQAGQARDPGFAVDEYKQFVLATSIGLVRRDNQDRVVVARYVPSQEEREYFTLVALCDGMGGGVQGARCAEIALCSVIDALLGNEFEAPGSNMLEAVFATNAAIGSAFGNRGGTTFIGLLHTNAGGLIGVHVGDSRAYRINREAGELTQLTEDHNLAARMARSEGKAGDSDAYAHLANQLTQCLGMTGDISPQSFELDITAGEALLLTSDGLHRIGADRIRTAVQQSQGLEETAQQLIDASHETGGVDNASLALVDGSALGRGEPGVLELYSPGLASLRIAEDALR